MEDNKSTNVKKTVKSGITFGSALAMVISYTAWKSVGWAIFHLITYKAPRQTGSCKFLYYHIFKTCFAFALTNWIIGPEMITVISVHTPNFPPNKTPVTTTKISNAIRTNLICQ